MKKKKILALFLSAAMLFGITAAASADEADATDATESSIEETVVETEETSIETTFDEVVTETNEVEETEYIEVVVEEADSEEVETEDEIVIEVIAEDVEEAEESEAVEEETTIEVIVEETVTEETEPEETEIVNLYNYEGCNYIPVNLTYYATADVTVRVSPDPNAESIGTISFGDAITVVGYSEYSCWFEISYGDSTAFVSCGSFVISSPNTWSSSDIEFFNSVYLSETELEQMYVDLGFFIP